LRQETTSIQDTPDELLASRARILRAEDRRLVDEELLATLDHERPEIRSRAVQALGRIGDVAYADRVTEALDDEAPEVRSRAAFALGLLDASEGLEALADHVGDLDAEVRASVADGLGLLGDPLSESVMLSLLNDAEPAVLAAACFGVARFDHASFAVDRLVELSAETEPEVLLACTHALAELASEGGRLDRQSRLQARQRMIELVESRHPQLRRLAAIGLTIPTSEREAVAQGKLIEDSDYTVRIAAVEALTFPGAPVEPFLSKALEDEDERVLLAVIDGLGRMRGPEVLELLAWYIVHDERLWLRERAVVAVGRASNLSAQMANGLSRADDAEIRRAAAALLAGRIDDDDPLVRAAIVPSFADAPGELAALLADAIDDENQAVRAAVARAAGRRLADGKSSSDEKTEALGVLERLWTGAQKPLDVEVASAVMRAAGQAGRSPEARSLLERGLSCSDRTVRMEAIRQTRRVWDEDRSSAAGAASDRPLEDYVEILRWAQRERAAIVTVRRPGFVPGRFTVRLDTESTPLAAWNFARLAESGFYDDLPFYAVTPGVVLRSGDPRGNGTGGPGYTIRDEIDSTRFWPGTLGMVSAGRDRAGSAWFVALSMQPGLADRYTAFGSVVQNFTGVVARLLPRDRVVSVRVYEGDGTEPLPPLED
jgi:cyclophilin family peptidyl-prolyl cis-trans isomerase/HEAT repeat protein